MLVFAVETSCDETSVCILNKNKKIFSHIVYSQKEHEIYGGVIPELASRSHLEILQTITQKAFNESNLNINDIDIFCATCGPGLIGGLLVGSTFVKGLAVGLNKPFIPINHLEGHLLSPTFNNKITFPHLSLLLTGGHTQMYLINSIGNYELLGETLDDAIGEAFDKVGKLLGLSYPGGPEIEKMAMGGDSNKFNLPHPLEKQKVLNFSFSGIKTAVNLIVQKENKKNKIFIKNLSASFQKKITSILESKLILAMKYLKKNKIEISHISVVGGVAANKYIIEKLLLTAKKNHCTIVLPPKYMLSDNAAMIGWASIIRYNLSPTSNLDIQANPRLKITNFIK